MIQIRHKSNGKVILEIRSLADADLTEADLTEADLTEADLTGARLRGARLRGARLTDADLRGADLRGADLTGADLTGARLRGADLTEADLTEADLMVADLTGADLTGARLRGARLTGADLTEARLTGADLTGVAASLGIEVDPTLPGRIVAQIEAHPESWGQGRWHSTCGTRHCIAGHATWLSGALGSHLDRQLGTATAATLLLWRPGVEMPSFAANAIEDETLGRLRKMAARAL